MPAITPEDLRRFDAELALLLPRFPPDRKQAAMIPALRIFQGMHGYVSTEAMAVVAERLGVPPSAAREVVTFYTMLHEEKPGRYLLDVCTNVSCSLRGAERLLAYLEQKLGIHVGQTTPDGRFTLRETECLASCGTAPCLQVNERYEENLTEAKLDQLMAQWT